MKSSVLAVLLCFAVMGFTAQAQDNQYVGADKCKNCHSAATKGDPYGHWLKSSHAKAYETLASEASKKIAAEKKIADPQKDEGCLSCHTTAAGLPATAKSKKFDLTKGVQCESCHGPGGNHVKARLAVEIPADGKMLQVGPNEIKNVETTATCTVCHNEKSPTYKPFDFKARLKEIAHFDPRRNHPADYADKLAESIEKASKKEDAPKTEQK